MRRPPEGERAQRRTQRWPSPRQQGVCMPRDGGSDIRDTCVSDRSLMAVIGCSVGTLG